MLGRVDHGMPTPAEAPPEQPPATGDEGSYQLDSGLLDGL